LTDLPRSEPESGGEAAPGLESTAPWSRLTRRADYQRAGRGRRAHREAFTLQANRRAEGETQAGPRIGLTVTKKVGNAVVRNRIRRRLREALRKIAPDAGLPDHDYVVMARDRALTLGFEALIAEIGAAFADLKRMKPRANPGGQSRERSS